jgi:hypothetical protein
MSVRPIWNAKTRLNATTQSVTCKHNEDPLAVLANFVSYLIGMNHPADRLIKVMDDDTGQPIYVIPLGIAKEGIGAITRIAVAANDNGPDIAHTA